MAHVAKQYDEALRRQVEEILRGIQWPHQITDAHVKKVLEIAGKGFEGVPRDARDYLHHAGAANAVKGLVDERLEKGTLDANALALYARILQRVGKIKRMPRSEGWRSAVVSALSEVFDDVGTYQDTVEEVMGEVAEAGNQEAVEHLRKVLGEIFVAKSALVSALVRLGYFAAHSVTNHLSSVTHYARQGLIKLEDARRAIEAADVEEGVKKYYLQGIEGTEERPANPRPRREEGRGSRMLMSM